MALSAWKDVRGMIGVDMIGRIRRAYFDQHRPIKEIVRTLSVSRATVRKVVRSQATEFKYERGVQPVPKLGEWVEDLTAILEREAKLPRRERRSTQRLFKELRGRGYDGAHDSVHRFAKLWREERTRVPARAFVPMSFAPGEARDLIAIRLWEPPPYGSQPNFSVPATAARLRADSNFSNGNTRDRQRRLITCEHRGRRVTRTEYDGTITVLADRYEGKRLNLLRLLPAGAVAGWATHWKAPPSHGAHVERTLRIVTGDVAIGVKSVGDQ
jgi:hypothetical protein